MTDKLKVSLAAVAILVVLAVCAYFLFSGPDLQSSDPAKRIAAIGKLVGRTDAASVKILVGCVDDSDTEVAASAIRALGRGKAPGNRSALRNIIDKNGSGPLRGEAAAALGRFKDANFKVLVNMLENDKDPKARIGAARGLRRLSHPKTAVALADALDDPDPNVRHAVYVALGGVTSVYFRFDPAKSPETQSDNIDKIRRTVSRLGVAHTH